jgi:tetratricopeptide (TPR) repeat protein
MNLARAYEKSQDWGEARLTWAKVEQFKPYAAEAIFRQAQSAFKGGDLKAAIDIAPRAIAAGGATKGAAMQLYGDALLRAQEWERAKNVFVNLRRGTTGAEKVAMTKKIIQCNRALKLNDNDGL